MSFTITESKDVSHLDFQVKNVDLCIVNAIRRIILAEIPNVAFDFDAYNEINDIDIHTNTGALHNEFLGHRISLIPLCFDEEEIANFTPEKYRFVLKKKNDTSEIIHVTTADFEIYDENNMKYDDKFKKKIFPANKITKDHILITKLKPNLYDMGKGEEIDIECRASVNVAKTHARWSPVSKCTFMNTLDEKAIKAGAVNAKDKNKFDTLDKYRLFQKNKYDEPNSFDFSIESECRLTPKYLVKKAFEVLISKLSAFQSNLRKEGLVEVTKDGNIDNFYILNIYNESHTLLNVLQSMIYNQCFRDISPEENVLEYIGFHQSHPLDNKMVMKIKFNTENVDIDQFLGQQCEKIVNALSALQSEWDATV